MKSIEVSNKHVLGTVSQATLDALKPEAAAALETLQKQNGAGNDFLGWLDLPSRTPQSLLDDIKETAAALRKECDYVVGPELNSCIKSQAQWYMFVILGLGTEETGGCLGLAGQPA